MQRTFGKQARKLMQRTFQKTKSQAAYSILRRDSNRNKPPAIKEGAAVLALAHSDIMRYPLPAVLPPPVLVSFSNPHSNMMRYHLLAALHYPLLFSLLVKSRLEYDAIYSLSCLASSCARFWLNPWSNMMRCPLLAALPHPLLCSFLIEVRFKFDALTSFRPLLRSHLIESLCNILS